MVTRKSVGRSTGIKILGKIRDLIINDGKINLDHIAREVNISRTNAKEYVEFLMSIQRSKTVYFIDDVAFTEEFHDCNLNNTKPTNKEDGEKLLEKVLAGDPQ